MIDLGILLRKAKVHRNLGKFGRWIHFFPTGRQQVVLVYRRTSEVSDVLLKVPQGTVVSPLLFLIYILDISKGVNANIKGYIDDARIQRYIQNKDDV